MTTLVTPHQGAKLAKLLGTTGTIAGAEQPQPGAHRPGWRGMRAQSGDLLVWIDTDRRALYVIDSCGWHAPLTVQDLPRAAVAA